jgi:hypothetical protein
MGPVAQLVFKTSAVVQPTARSVRLRRRSVSGNCASLRGLRATRRWIPRGKLKRWKPLLTAPRGTTTVPQLSRTRGARLARHERRRGTCEGRRGTGPATRDSLPRRARRRHARRSRTPTGCSTSGTPPTAGRSRRATEGVTRNAPEGALSDAGGRADRSCPSRLWQAGQARPRARSGVLVVFENGPRRLRQTMTCAPLLSLSEGSTTPTPRAKEHP